MGLSIIFTPEAAKDTLEAYNHYKNISLDLADGFNTRLDQKINLIQSHPESSPVVYKRFRRSLLKTFPYAIFYSVEDDQIRIFGLIHQRQHFPDLLEERK